MPLSGEGEDGKNTKIK